MNYRSQNESDVALLAWVDETSIVQGTQPKHCAFNQVLVAAFYPLKPWELGTVTSAATCPCHKARNLIKQAEIACIYKYLTTLFARVPVLAHAALGLTDRVSRVDRVGKTSGIVNL